MPTHYARTREVWYGSPVATGLDTDSTATTTITFNEATRADLDRLCGWAHADAISSTLGYAGFDFIRAVDVTSLLIKGSDQYIVGRNTPTAAFPLAADRPRPRLWRLGSMDFASQDTIAMIMGIQGTNVQASCGLAVPGTSSLLNARFKPTTGPQVLGEGGGAQVAAAGSATLTITADRAGFVHLSDLVISALQDATAESEVGAPNPYDALGGVYLTSFTLPGSDELVRGTGTGTVPAAAYGPHRPTNVINHGWLQMDAGSAITIAIVNVGPDIVNVRAGFPFWPTAGGGACVPC